MFGKAWKLGKDSVTSFINDGALSRGAAIAFYTVTPHPPDDALTCGARTAIQLT
jgi:phospholipase C